MLEVVADASPRDDRAEDQHVHREGQRDDRIEVGRRGTAEGRAEGAQRQDVELIEQEHEDENRDEKRYEGFAGCSERIVNEVGDE